MKDRFHIKVKNLRQLYEAQGRRLLGYLLRRTGDPQLAADLTQEAFTRCLERYPDREPNAALLFVIGRHLLYDHARRKTKQVEFQEADYPDGKDPEAQFLVRDECRRMLSALQQLADEERDLLSLAATSGLSYQEIAAMTGHSLANVKVKVHRARLRLRKILDVEAS
jgi:RNA polymerase sigma-70 factor (ECF subfamily)